MSRPGMGLAGYVLNNSQGVIVEAEGGKDLLRRFIQRLDDEKRAYRQ